MNNVTTTASENGESEVLAAGARRRTARVLRTTCQAAPAKHMTMGRGSPRRVRETQSALSANWLTTASQPPTKPLQLAPRSQLPVYRQQRPRDHPEPPPRHHANQHPSRRPHPPPDTNPLSHSYPYYTIPAGRARRKQTSVRLLARCLADGDDTIVERLPEALNVLHGV
jgi:hypothetical protein